MVKYVFEMIAMGQEAFYPMPLQQFIEQAMAEGQMAGGKVQYYQVTKIL